jgi:hypothetical protein
MTTSEFCFKACGTCVVLVIALSIAGWIGLSGIWGIVAFLAVIAGIALVVGIIVSIWE